MNSNGILSFRTGFTDFNPVNFPLSSNRDDILIAPFWDDVNINVAGDIFYRFTTNQSLLDEVGGNISKAFEVVFKPVMLFVATWNEVARLSGSSSIVRKHELTS